MSFSDVGLQQLQDTLELAPMFVHRGLMDNGLTIVRWQQNAAVPSPIVRYTFSSYVMSLILRPMETIGWYGERRTMAGEIDANTFRVTPPGLETSWRCTTAFDFVLFVFTDETIDRVAGDRAEIVRSAIQGLTNGPSGRISTYIRDDMAANLGRQMMVALEQPLDFSEQFADGLGLSLIARLLGRCLESSDPASTGGLSPNKLSRIKRFIDDNIDKELKVRELALQADLSEFHFARAFKASTGASPHRYVLSRRMQIAERKLEETADSVSMIATACGFKESGYFSRVFRSIYGQTPQRFRQCKSTNAHRSSAPSRLIIDEAHRFPDEPCPESFERRVAIIGMGPS